ncbi:MAG: YggS family pyridoxal phosphate-dependent enzyme [Chloroflexota bacterium]
MSIEYNVAQVMARIAAAARRAGRDPDEVTVVAVAKTFPSQAVVQAHRAGVAVLGENKVQEAAPKIAAVAGVLGTGTVSWHMVGHLQRNKARQAIRLFDCIHSLDSIRLAEELEKRGAACDRRLPLLLEINVSREATKFGLPADDHPQVEQVVEFTLAQPHLSLQGLMAIAPLVAQPEQARPYFRQLRQLRDGLARRFPAADLRHLSMGMSDDFEIAVEEGATLVRIGRAIFGERHTT